MWLNLQNFLILDPAASSELLNAVIAFGHREKKVIVVRPEWHECLDDIKVLVRGISPFRKIDFKYLWGDGFVIDTWNDLVRNYKEEPTGFDFAVVYDPSTPLLIPQTDAARKWVKANVLVSPWQDHGRIAVEPRYMADLLEGIRDFGMSVEEG